MKTLRLLFLTCLAGFISGFALACSPIKAHPVFFEINSSEISGEQLKRLSNWASEMKAQYPARQLIETEVSVEIKESDGIQLGWNRELAVRLALLNLDFTAPAFNPSGRVLIQPPRPAGTAGGVPTRSVWINFLPGCPHECPCQKSWKPEPN